MLARILIVFALFSLGMAQTAYAQHEPSPADVAAAREQFERGIAAARANHWPEALDAFAQSYDFAPRPMTLLNLAGAQAQTGHLRDASDSYRQFLAHPRASEIARYKQAAEQALADVDRRLGHVTVQLHGLLPTDEIKIDSWVVDQNALASEITSDPGDRVLTVRRGEMEVARQAFNLPEGGHVIVSAEVRIVQIDPNAVRPEDPLASHGNSVLSSPWLWVGVGAGVAIAATVVIIIIATSHSKESAPYTGNAGIISL